MIPITHTKKKKKKKKKEKKKKKDPISKNQYSDQRIIDQPF